MSTRLTFTEVLLIVLILTVVGSIVVPGLSSAAAEGKRTRCDRNWANLIRALDLYVAANDGAYPLDQNDFNTLILNSKTFFPKASPVCPYGQEYIYISKPGRQTVVRHSH